MKRILVPTDFSIQAQRALDVALQIAKKNKGEIYLLHSVELPLHLANSSPGQLPESLFFIKLAEKKFSELLNNENLKNAPINTVIGHDEIFKDIQNSISKNNIDLIVMGSHGATGFEEMFIGSNTEKVVRTASVPVLVIKNEHPMFKVNHFVFATDFTEECVKPFLKAKTIAENLGAKINLLYVNTPSNFKTSSQIWQLMEQFIEKTKPNNYELSVYNELDIEKGILNFAKETGAQLIGMSTHGRKGIAHFFNGSISEDLVNHANMPVITFRI